MSKLKFKVEATFEEAITALEKNKLDMLKEIINFNPKIIMSDSVENNNNKLIFHSIKFNNALAFDLLFELSNLYKQNIIYNTNKPYIYQPIKISELMSKIIEYSSCNIFIYLVKRFNLSNDEFMKEFLNKLFEGCHFTIIDYLLNHTDFRYRVKKKFLLLGETNSNTIVYFNCHNEEEKQNSFCLDNVLETNSYLVVKLGIIKTYKYLFLKYKAMLPLEFSDSTNNKILKFLS